MVDYRRDAESNHSEDRNFDPRTPGGDLDGEYRDFFDGKIYQRYLRRVKGLFKDHRSILLHLSMDGVPIIREGKPKSVTPVLLQILNLPPWLRQKRRNMILSMIIPGDPPEIACWLKPLWRELQILSKGVWAIDGAMKRDVEEGALHYETDYQFKLQAWMVIAVGDQVAMCKLCGMKGAGSKHGCRRCWMTGTRIPGSRNKLYYYPHHGATGKQPERTNFEEIARMAGMSKHDSVQKEVGVNAVSPLLDLPNQSVFFTRAIPYGIMHMIPIGITKLMFSIWRGVLPTEQQPANRDPASGVPWSPPPFVIDEFWSDFGNELVNSASTLPAALGDAPMNINTQRTGYTAHQLHNFILLYSVPLLSGRLPEEYLQHWITFVRAYEMLMSWTMNNEIVNEMEVLFAEWVEGYERMYVQHVNDGYDTVTGYYQVAATSADRMAWMTSNVHALLHLADQVRDCGPAFNMAEWCIERYCGYLKPHAKSRQMPEESLMYAAESEEMVKLVDIACPWLGLKRIIEEMDPPELHNHGYETKYGFLLPKVCVVKNVFLNGHH